MIFKRKFFTEIFNNREEIILRDYLALERTRLANERTLLAYSRTSLYMLLGGIAFLQLEEFRRIQWIGYVALALSVILITIGVFRYFQIKSRLSRYYEWDKAENGSRENSQAGSHGKVGEHKDHRAARRGPGKPNEKG